MAAQIHFLAFHSALKVSHLHFNEKSTFPVAVSFFLAAGRLAQPSQTTEPRQDGCQQLHEGIAGSVSLFQAAVAPSTAFCLSSSGQRPVPSGSPARCGKCIFIAVSAKGLCFQSFPTARIHSHGAIFMALEDFSVAALEPLSLLSLKRL